MRVYACARGLSSRVKGDEAFGAVRHIRVKACCLSLELFGPVHQCVKTLSPELSRPVRAGSRSAVSLEMTDLCANGPQAAWNE